MKDITNVVLAAFSDKGTVRGNNEDNLFSNIANITNNNSEDSVKKNFLIDYTEKTMIFAVFDGMGGTYGGEIASLCATNIFASKSEEIAKSSVNDLPNVFDTLKGSIEQAILKDEGFNVKNMPGTTCCVLLIRNGKVVPFWIGDSRIYMLRGNKLILLTKDHTVAQEKIDYGLISQDEAMSTSGWHHLTAYVGDLHSKFSMGSEFELEVGDRFLLCSDGISDKFKAEEIANYMNSGIELCLTSFEKEVKIESKDNATALILEFNNNEHHKFGDAIKKRTMECVDAVINSVKKLE